MSVERTHNDAMGLIDGACSVTTLSYEEAIAIYLRARGVLRDGAEVLGEPIPADWNPDDLFRSGFEAAIGKAKEIAEGYERHMTEAAARREAAGNPNTVALSKADAGRMLAERIAALSPASLAETGGTEDKS